MSRLLNNPRHLLFLLAAIRALRLHRRLSSLLGAEDRLFKGLSFASGKFGVSERGVRYELWDALGDLEFLLLRTKFSGPTSSSKRSHTIQPPRLLQGENAQGSGKSPYSASSPSMIPRASAHDPRAMPTPAAWPRLIQERYAPARWAAIHGRRGDQGRSEHHEPGNGVGSALASAVPFIAATHVTRAWPQSRFLPFVPVHVRLGQVGSLGRDSHSADGAATGKHRPATRLTLFPPVSFPVTSPAIMAAEEPGRRPIVEQGDSRDEPWRSLVSQSRGTALGIVQRVRLEPFFPDMDLGAVRIHIDEPADRAARALRADAFSLGRDIYFRARRFNPATQKGLALLGHELVHTRQVTGGEPFPTMGQRKGLEQEAEITEASFLRAFTVGGVPRNEQQALPFSGAGKTYAPLSLEPVRTRSFLPRDGSMARDGERAISLSALPGGNGGGYPLKAEEGRSASAGAGSAAASTSSSDDQEGAARALFRALDRKLQTEKERRGIDRWVR